MPQRSAMDKRNETRWLTKASSPTRRKIVRTEASVAIESRARRRRSSKCSAKGGRFFEEHFGRNEGRAPVERTSRRLRRHGHAARAWNGELDMNLRALAVCGVVACPLLA